MTAVEWLVEQLECFGNKHELQLSWATVDELVEHAKQMEKEQLSDAWYAGDEDGPIHYFEDYYQEQFKKK